MRFNRNIVMNFYHIINVKYVQKDIFFIVLINNVIKILNQ